MKVKFSNYREKEAVVNYVVADVGSVVEWILDYNAAHMIVLKKCLVLGFSPRIATRNDLGKLDKRRGVEGGHIGFVVKGVGDIVIKDREQAWDWLVSKAGELNAQEIRDREQIKRDELVEARGNMIVTETEQKLELARFQEWLRNLPYGDKDKGFMGQLFIFKTLIGTQLERQRLYGYAKHRGVQVRITKPEWVTVEATWKDKLEAKGTRMRELAELEVGDVIELDLKTTNMQRAEAAVGRFNKNNKGRRLTYSIYAAVMKIWRVE